MSEIRESNQHHQAVGPRPALILLLLAAALGACTSAVDSAADPAQLMEETTTQGAVDPMGEIASAEFVKVAHELGIELRWEPLELEFAAPGTDPGAPLQSAQPALDQPPLPEDPDRTGWFVVDPVHQRAYTVTMPRADLARLGEVLLARGIHHPSASSAELERPIDTIRDDEQDGLIEKSWAGGVDNRVLKGIAQDGMAFNLTPMGYVDRGGDNATTQKGCTGTLFGPRHALTAAHCVFNQFGQALWLGFSPRRDGNTMPFGGQLTIYQWGPVEYTNNACHINPNGPTACPAYDIAVLVFPSSQWTGNPGWAGFNAYTDAQIAAGGTRNRGYPSCNASILNKPASCQWRMLYGENANCAFGYLTDPVTPTATWKRNLTIGCDVSGGHSGGALYLNGPIIQSMAIRESCYPTCQATDLTPNVALRITPTYRDTMAFIKAYYP